MFVGSAALPKTLFADGEFQFAGLSLRTTIEEARKRYPRSMILGQHVYVSDAESRDGVHAIDVPDASPNRSLRLNFERATARGNAYPACDTVLQTLRTQYGAPATVQEFDEERLRNRRLTWRRGAEEMSLLCFRRATQPYSAAELTIAYRANQ